jgi:NDP-sugar pyrophosphorylase family protein
MICDAFDRCVDLGVERMIVNTHHCASRYEEFFPQKRWRGVPLIFKYEPVLLETAGGLKNIEELILGENLLIYNGDVLANFQLAPFIEKHLDSGVEVTLASEHKRNRGKSAGIVIQKESGLFVRV